MHSFYPQGLLYILVYVLLLVVGTVVHSCNNTFVEIHHHVFFCLFVFFCFLFMKFVHGTGINQIAIKLIRWRLHSIASYIKTVRKNR